MEKIFKIVLFKEVENFVLDLNTQDQEKISGAINALRSKQFENIYIKKLRSEIGELRVKRFRLIFFIHQDIVYISKIFVKKSNKTPKREIDLAEKYYEFIVNN